MAQYLLEDLRIDRTGFERMDLNQLDELAAALRSHKVALAAGLLRDLRTGR
jgi:Holliday junction resolvasome RuvABC ATP-dependent DNA helicase subunit